MKLSKSMRRDYQLAKLDFLATGKATNVYLSVIQSYKNKKIDPLGIDQAVFDEVYHATLQLRKRRRDRKRPLNSPIVPFVTRYMPILKLQNKLRSFLLKKYSNAYVYCIGGTTDCRSRTWIDGDKIVFVVESKYFNPDREDLGPVTIHPVLTDGKKGPTHLGYDVIIEPSFKIHFRFERETIQVFGDNKYYKEYAGVMENVDKAKNEAWKKIFSYFEKRRAGLRRNGSGTYP